MQTLFCHQLPRRLLHLLSCFGLAGCLILGAGSVLADDELDFGLQDQRLYQIHLNGNETFSDYLLKNVLQILAK